MVQKEKNTLQLIQLLRGVASLLVVFFHVSSNYADSFNRHFLGNIFAFGGSGVDIFFVLSGFIITYTSINKIGTPGAIGIFTRRRFVRIFPTYWIIISFFLIMQALLPQFYKSHFDFSFLNLLKTFLLLPQHEMVNGVSWSLTNELFFYLLFILAFLLPSKRVVFICLLLYSTFLLVSGAGNYFSEKGNPYLSLITSPLNIEFFFGVIVALIFARVNKNLAVPFLILGIGLFITGATLFNFNIVLFKNSFNRVVLFGIPSFFIILAVVVLEKYRNINVHGILLKLGDASYSLYLLHLPFVAAAVKLIAKSGIDNNIVIHFLLLLVIAGLCGMSILFFKHIERPVIKKINTFGKLIFS